MPIFTQPSKYSDVNILKNLLLVSFVGIIFKFIFCELFRALFSFYGCSSRSNVSFIFHFHCHKNLNYQQAELSVI